MIEEWHGEKPSVLDGAFRRPHRYGASMGKCKRNRAFSVIT